MTIRRVSLLLPCSRIEDFPANLSGDQAADLLAAWTAVWHPAILSATGALPGWHPAGDAPDPTELENELVVVPTASRQQLASDWCDRLRETAPRNPPPVEAVASRERTLAALLSAAGMDANQTPAEVVADFLALGHTHLQVELLTQAMRYSSVLDTEQFTGATIAAAHAAVAGETQTAQAELSRAFDLLSDARNHVYAVDFYLVDVTLLAASTLGESLRTKLATDSPTSLLLTGELLERLAGDQQETLDELRRSIRSGIACVVGGTDRGDTTGFESPEAMLASFQRGQQAAQRHLETSFQVYGQFESAFSRWLPDILSQFGYQGALYAAFDGRRLPGSDQRKTWWRAGDGASIQALASMPFDVALPETWLRLGQRIGDTIAHDHVATIVLAGWPGRSCEYYDDLRRAARFSPVLGKLVTLEEYFRVSREPDEWTTLTAGEYPISRTFDIETDPISKSVDRYRDDVFQRNDELAAGIVAIAGLRKTDDTSVESANTLLLNPWSFARPLLTDCDLQNAVDATTATNPANPLLLPAVPGCGFATLAAAAPPSETPLAKDRTLRNEQFELTVSEATGGIQSFRRHRDRSTRLSQRLVFYDQHSHEPANMFADEIMITRNDAVMGEITSHGRLLNAAEELLASFRQTVRLTRDGRAAVVDIQLDPTRLPTGQKWQAYFGSRIAWRDDALAFRRGVQWIGREANRERIVSPEWVEVEDGIGTITCFGLGLPFHRQASENYLDTLLVVPGESQRRFQLALSIDEPQPTQAALDLLTASRTTTAILDGPPTSPSGWFLHITAKDVLLTHIEPLTAPRTGLRVRLLETVGQDTKAALAAFRPFRVARSTDFRGELTGVLSVHDGRVEFDIGPNRWIQLEAEW